MHSALKYAKGFNLEILEHPKAFRKLFGPYASSKLALSLWTQAIAPQLAKDSITIRSVDPGSNNTLRKGKKSGLPIWIKLFMKLFFSPPTHGANLLYEGALGEYGDETGVFLLKGQVAELPYTEQAQNVLQRINKIYECEFNNGERATAYS